MKCRFCNNKLKDVLDLGDMPLANNFSVSSDIKKYPLKLCVCESCKLLQLADTVNYKSMFNNYPYYSSSNAPLVTHFKNTAEWIMNQMSDDPNHLIAEIGCNDGIFLENFIGKRRVIGIDPSYNFKPILSEKKIDHITQPFNLNTAQILTKSHGKAKIIFAANVLAHIPDINETMKAVNELLSDNGYFIFEVHYALDLLQNCSYDQIYHEHVYYFTSYILNRILNDHGLYVSHEGKLNIHGSSVRIVCQREKVQCCRRMEINELANLNIDNIQFYDAYKQSFISKKKEIFDTLLDLKTQKKKIVGYGAPAKATIMCNSLKIDKRIISYTIDNTPAKQNTYIPGTDIFINKPEHLYNDKLADYIFLFSWNYEDFILNKEIELRKTKKFIIPFPKLHII